MEHKCVLAVECDWRVRTLIRANLEALGLRVHEAVTGQHGLMLLRECAPDLLLVDHGLPDMEVEQFLGAVVAVLEDRRIPVILTSDDPLEHRFARPDAAIKHLQKPFSAPSLVHQVRAALDMPFEE